MSVCSKNAKLGPSTDAASAQLPERAQLLLASCLILLKDIVGELITLWLLGLPAFQVACHICYVLQMSS
jgi:hypothetical protein